MTECTNVYQLRAMEHDKWSIVIKTMDGMKAAVTPDGAPITHNSKSLVQAVIEEINRTGSEEEAFDEFGYLRLICSEIDMARHGLSSFFETDIFFDKVLDNDGFFQELDAPEEAARLGQMSPIQSYLEKNVGFGLPGDHVNDSFDTLVEFVSETANDFSDAQKTVAISVHQGTGSLILGITFASGNCPPCDYGTVGCAVQGMVPKFSHGEPSNAQIQERSDFLASTGEVMLEYIRLSDTVS